MLQMDFFTSIFNKEKSKLTAKELSEFEGFPLEIAHKPYYRKIAISLPLSGKIIITTGKSTSTHEILAFLNANKGWVLKAQKELLEIKSQFPKVDFKNFDTLFWRGKKLKLYYLNKDSKNNFLPSTEYFSCTGSEPKSSTSQQALKKNIRDFYKEEGVREISELINIWSKKMELYPKKISYRLQKSKWGSCGSNGHISMNWGLITCPNKVIEYVVIHELAHLKHQDHSKNFWALVEKYCPDYKQRRAWLKNHNYICDFLQTKSQLYS